MAKGREARARSSKAGKRVRGKAKTPRKARRPQVVKASGRHSKKANAGSRVAKNCSKKSKTKPKAGQAKHARKPKGNGMVLRNGGGSSMTEATLAEVFPVIEGFLPVSDLHFRLAPVCMSWACLALRGKIPAIVRQELFSFIGQAKLRWRWANLTGKVS